MSAAQKLSEHFTWDEFNCPCGRLECDAPKEPSPLFLFPLERARKIFNHPMIVNSWARCLFHNKAIGGARFSQHLSANAIDIECINSKLRWKLVTAFIECGFSIVVYGNWIHADRRTGEPILILG